MDKLKKLLSNDTNKKVVTGGSKKLSNRTILAISVIAFLCVTIVCVAVRMAKVADQQLQSASGGNDQSAAAEKTKKLKIASEPAGVVVQGPKECNETFAVPYECEFPDRLNEDLVFIAPASAEIDGKKMNFVTWDGCSASNKDKRYCDVKRDFKDGSEIKAVYKADGGGGSSNATPSTSNSPAPTNGKPPVPAKPPLSNCPNTPNASGVVTCSTTVFQAPFTYALTIDYPRNENGGYTYAQVASNPYISCNSNAICEPINARPNTVPSIVGGLSKPGTMTIKLLANAESSDGKKLKFDKWSVEYDPNRFPNGDPSQHTVYFVTAHYSLVNE